jgi:hypothetical protein
VNTLTLSEPALTTINRFLHFKVGSAVCSVPYFNNRTIGARAAVRAYNGKGNTDDITTEVETIIVKNHVPLHALADESLKKLLVDNRLGIDCSAFTYYILESENKSRRYPSFRNRLSAVNRRSLLGKIVWLWRTVENCDVRTLASNLNSVVVPLGDVKPGDIITMTGDNTEAERNHILVIHRVDYDGDVPREIHYSHAVAYPEDGLYGTGARQGLIRITDVQKPLTEALWIEDDKQGTANRLHQRALKSTTEIRRLKWWQ